MKIYIDVPSQSFLQPNYRLELNEDDGNSFDDQVDIFTLPREGGVYRMDFSGISSFVDGANNKAELYLQSMLYKDVSKNADFWD